MTDEQKTGLLQINAAANAPADAAGQRLDRVLAALFSAYSRGRLQQWIKAGSVTVDGLVCTKPRQSLIGGEHIVIAAELEAAARWCPQPVELNIIFEDDSLIVVNKPAGLVVHPGAGNPDQTMVNGLLQRFPELSAVPRAGVVHRLDKGTSGVLVVARTLSAHHALVSQLQQRAFARHYQALVVGRVTAGGTLEGNIGRHPIQRTRMAVVNGGKHAVTHFRVAEHFPAHTLLNVKLETGRTHQIRVHLSQRGYPLVGDPLYGGRLQIPAGGNQLLAEGLRQFRRQALHAGKLGLMHPHSGEWMSWECSLPKDMQNLLAVLRQEPATVA